MNGIRNMELAAVLTPKAQASCQPGQERFKMLLVVAF